MRHKNLQRSCWGLLFGMGVSLPLAGISETLPLDDLVKDSDQALTIMRASAELDSAKSELERDRAQKGWRVFANAGYGHINSVIDVGRVREYNAVNEQVGFTYPLFGSYEKQSNDVRNSRAKVDEKNARLDGAHRMAALEIESAYADYWSAQESLKVIDAYLGTEPATMPKLRLRNENRLMVQSQLMELQQNYDQARADRLRFERLKHDAAGRLGRLTGRSLDEFEAQQVALPPPPAIPVDTLVQNHPDLVAIEAQRKALQEQLQNSGWYGTESNAEISQSGIEDLSANQKGGVSYAGLRVDAPLGIMGVRRAEHERLQAELRGTELRYQQRKSEISDEAQGAQDKWQELSSELKAAQQRSQALSEGLREAGLRNKVLETQGIEPLALQEHDYYAAALARIDAQAKAWQSNIDVRGYAAVAASESSTLPSPSETDLGRELAQPFSQAPQSIPPRGSNAASHGS